MAAEVESELKSEFVTVTKAAENHFRSLLQKEETEGMNLRIFVANPLTAHAEVSITFCPAGEEAEDDFAIPFLDFTIFIEKASEGALTDGIIDFKEDGLSGQLSIKAPYLKGRLLDNNSSLREKIQHVIDTEINPSLAGHGGKVSLVDLLEEKIVILQFGGGCHGCGMANITLKHGIEKTLKEKFPEIVEIRDITDHTTGKDPYC